MNSELIEKLDKLKTLPSRVRKAVYENENINVRIFSKSGRIILLDLLTKSNEKLNSEILSFIILDSECKPKYTPEYFLSDDCFDCEPLELINIWKDCQMGTIKKK